MPTNKPVWPHKAICHMSAHVAAGQWYRRAGGKQIYFGVLRDPGAALKRYLEWAAKEAAQPIIASSNPEERARVTADLGLNHFLNAMHTRYEEGSLSAGQFLRYKKAVTRILAVIDKTRMILSLLPEDFEGVRSRLKGKPRTVSNAIRDIRVAFNWIKTTYGVSPLFGHSLKRPSARAIKKSSTKRKLWSAKEIRRLLERSESNMKAMILLGINCAFGQTDCALFERSFFNLEAHWFPRPKTDIERRCTFWPETIAAIACIHRWRPDVMPDFLFMSKYGKILVRDDPILNADGQIIKTRRKDAIQQMFRRACVSAGVEYRPFYTLRHTFRSVADVIPDDTAVKAIMGHSLAGMDGIYVQLMDDGAARLRAVTDHVHRWLFD